MIILAIETSCDDTSAAVVKNGRKLLSNIVLSQEKLHKPFRGIVPEIASRSHLENINWVIAKALRIANCELGIGNLNPKSEIRNPKCIDAIAVTVGPGLIGSLLVGRMTAEALGWIWNKPVIGVNHLEAHLFANLIEYPRLAPPFLGLIVSGGHTELVLVRGYGNYRVLGRTRDDAVGECFDKAAKILGLPYPGGPEIDRLARKGNPNAIQFSRPYLNGTWDFSFSGIKTAVLYYWQKKNQLSVIGHQSSVKTGNRLLLTDYRSPITDYSLVCDICASFQRAVIDVLVTKTIRAAKKFGLKKVVVGGGVAANSELRERFAQTARKNHLQIFLPTKENCTDNAAMVAAAGYYKLQNLSWVMSHGSWVQKKLTTHDSRLTTALRVDPSLPIQNW